MDSPGSTPIKFGPAGWRAAMARDFTFANLRLAAEAVAEYAKAQLADPNSPLHRPPPNHNLNPNLNPNHPNSPLRRLPPTAHHRPRRPFSRTPIRPGRGQVLTAAEH